jgi:MSHA biogenesis protein MshG
MPIFEFKAVTTIGKLVTESIEAGNEQLASREIIKKGYRPISMTRKKESAASADGVGFFTKIFQKKIKVQDIVLFTQELVTLIKAGVPLLTSLEALGSQSGKEFGVILNRIYVDVMSGKSFSQALSAHPLVFSPLYVNSVRAAEMSGAMDDVLARMAVMLKADEEVKGKVKAALRYPTMVICAMAVAFLIIMLKVIPNFTKLFASFKMELPIFTKILMSMSSFMQHNFIIILVILIGGIVGFKWYTSTHKGKLWWDGFIMKIPVIGDLVIKSSMVRFTRMFETLNRSGLPIVQTLNIVSSAVGNLKVEELIKNVALGVEKGEGISGSMKKYNLFPPMVRRMISIGEQSGSLDDMLESVSKHYDVEVQNAISALTAMIEPMMTVCLGGAVAVMALGVFLPMWNMTSAIK